MARGDGSSVVQQQDNNSMLHQSSMMMENKMETNMNQLNAPVSTVLWSNFFLVPFSSVAFYILRRILY